MPDNGAAMIPTTPLLPPPLAIGPHRIDPPLLLAPMAGVTDRCFRVLARRLGAGLAVSEPAQLAEAARYNVGEGAEIIDINMGCPAKKVCRRDAGSALMRDEALVAAILEAVVAAVEVPVTLKMRTGYDASQRNAVRIARIAEAAGISALTVHGRTRADQYSGAAEYDTIAAVKAAVAIPVIANGDIVDAERAAQVLRHTGADALMIGRGAQGRPWIFAEIAARLRGEPWHDPSPAEVGSWLLEHLDGLHALYGPQQGVRVARKHIQWYCRERPGAEAFWQQVRGIDEASAQREAVRGWFADAGLRRAA